MTVLVRFRVEKDLLAKANAVTERLGTSTQEMMRIFLAEIARTGKVPVTLAAEEGDDAIPWKMKAEIIESFYDPNKAW